MELLCVFYLLAFLHSYSILITIFTCYAVHFAWTYDMEQLAHNASTCICALVVPALLCCFVWLPIVMVEMWIRDIEKLQTHAYE